MNTARNYRVKHLLTLFILLFSLNSRAVHADWSAPLQISAGDSSVNSSGTPLIINSDSTALVGWLDGQIGVAQTLSSASLFSNDSLWTTPAGIYTNTDFMLAPTFPIMAEDMFGNQTAGFSQLDFGNNEMTLSASRRLAGTMAWQAPVTETLSGFPSSSAVAIGNLSNIGAILALSTTGASPFDITFIQLIADGSAWSTPVVLAVDNSVQPVVGAKARQGLAYLAWKINTPSLQIQTTRYQFSNEQFSSAINVPLPPLASDIIGIDVAVDNSGNAILIYTAQFVSGTALYSSTLMAGSGSTWSAPLLISNPANDITLPPSSNGIPVAYISSNDAGTTTILWSEEVTGSQQFIRAATLPLGGTPTFVTDLTDNTALNTTVETARLAVDAFGNAVAIWQITTGGTSSIQTASKAIGKNWTPFVTLSSTGSSPLITLSNQGTAVATWIDMGTGILTGSRNTFLFALTPPSNFAGEVVKSQFLTQTAYFLNMQWTPSEAPHIVSYEIFKNGKSIAIISGDGPFTYQQPIKKKRVKDSYTLVATASNGNTSDPITLIIYPTGHHH